MNLTNLEPKYFLEPEYLKAVLDYENKLNKEVLKKLSSNSSELDFYNDYVNALYFDYALKLPDITIYAIAAELIAQKRGYNLKVIRALYANNLALEVLVEVDKIVDRSKL